MKIKADFKARARLRRRSGIQRWTAVLAAHALLIAWLSDRLPQPMKVALKPAATSVQVTLIEPALKPMNKEAVKNAVQPASDTLPAPQSVLQSAPSTLVVPEAGETPKVAVPVQASAPESLPTPATASVHSYVTPESIRLNYVVTKGSDSAKAALIWRVHALINEHRAYDLTYEATYFGVSMVKQTSLGSASSAGLSPTRFSDKRRGKSEQATHFDSEKQHITFSNNRPQAALLKGSQDRSSVLVQLASLFAGDPDKWRKGSGVDIPVASTDELETWRFEVQGEELLALPEGERATVHLTRRARRAFDQTVELWLAPSLSYMPVRIRHTDSSGVLDAQLVSFEKL